MMFQRTSGVRPRTAAIVVLLIVIGVLLIAPRSLEGETDYVEPVTPLPTTRLPNLPPRANTVTTGRTRKPTLTSPRATSTPPTIEEGDSSDGKQTELPPQTADATKVTLRINDVMATAWKSSSERKTFRTTMHFDGNELPCSATFYGKSSLKLKYTKRRSLHIVFDSSHDLLGISGLRSVLLLSLWEDHYRLAYRSSAMLLEKMGLLLSASRLVSVSCEGSASLCPAGSSFGVYLMIEYPTDAIRRHHKQGTLWRSELGDAALTSCLSDVFPTAAPHDDENNNGKLAVATRNWFYFEKPPKYDLLDVPSFKRNSTLSKIYRTIESNPSLLETVLDIRKYMLWVAVNTALRNGDYDDEVFFFGDGHRLGVMAWDYDTVFASCHRDGKNAMKEPLMFCAETPVEKTIRATPRLWDRYKRTLRCVLDSVLTVESWGNIVSETHTELQGVLADNRDVILKGSYERDCCPNAAEGKSNLVADFTKNRDALMKALGSSKPHNELSKAAYSSDVDSTQKIRVHQRSEAQNDTQPQLTERNVSLSNPSSGTETKNKPTFCSPKQIRLPRDIKREFKWSASLMVPEDFVATHNVKSMKVLSPDSEEPHILVAGKPLKLTRSGLHCLVVDMGNCIVPHPIIIRDKERGKAEYGIPPYAIPGPADVANVEERELKVVVPASWLSDRKDKMPAFARRVDASGAWVRTNNVRAFNGQLIPRGQGVVRTGATDKTTLVDGRKDFVPIYKAATLQSSHTVPENSRVTVSTTLTVSRKGTLTIKSGTIVLFEDAKAVLKIAGELVVEGTETNPVVFTSMNPNEHWGGIFVSGTAKFSYTFLSRSGGSKQRVPGTGTHRPETPTFTVFGEGTLNLADVAVFDALGPGIGASAQTTVELERCVFQEVAQGIECTGCTLKSSAVSWNFISQDPSALAESTYVDEDNDAIYLHGGDHVLTGNVIHGTLDDGIDTGGSDGTLTVTDIIIERCQHEGIALSSEEKAERRVTVVDSLIQHTQQGIECGYTSSKHMAIIRNTQIRRNYVGVRYGDNYHNKVEEGHVLLEGCRLDNNIIPLMNLVRRSPSSPPMQLSSGKLVLRKTSISNDRPTFGRAERDVVGQCNLEIAEWM